MNELSGTIAGVSSVTVLFALQPVTKGSLTLSNSGVGTLAATNAKVGTTTLSDT